MALSNVDEAQFREAIGLWEERRVWRAFLITSALLAIVYPLANFVGAPPGTEPLRLRLALAAGAIALSVPMVVFPPLRRYARVALQLEIVAFYIIQGLFLTMSQFEPYVVSRAILVISAIPLIAPTVLDVELALGTFAITILLASIAEHRVQANLISGPFGTVLLACIIAGIVGVASIASRRREIESRLAVELALEDRLALMRTRDRLTGLPNFERFTSLCEDAIASAFLRNCSMSVIVIELDRLREIEAQYGTRNTDELVLNVARRFETSARKAVISRIRTDAFAVIAGDTDGLRAKDLAYEILESLADPFLIGNVTLYVTATAGVAVYPHDGTTVDALLARCDSNIRRARTGKHDAVSLVSGESDAHMTRLRELREDLRNALANGEFRLLYQPCVDSRSGLTVSAEALLRWEHPVYGTISPLEFVPMLESDGTIASVGEWVLREALHACSGWRAVREIDVSVNVSLEQFRDLALFARVRSALHEAHMPARALIIELTESVAVHNVEETLRTMNACRTWGVKFALDDFGTGYSAMSYLKDLPVDEIKIDRSFMQGLPDDIGDCAIVKAIISLAHTRGCTVYAEGVENREQARWLAGERCDVLQGIVVSAPLSATEFTAWLESASTRRLYHV